jgi:hypothetical protein
MERTIKILLAILFFLCLADMPYGYYQILRIVSMIGFSILAFYSAESKNYPEAFLFIGLVLLFQPFEKIALGRTLWNIVDFIVAVFLLFRLKRQKI